MELDREEIIKALECCTSGNSVSACMSGCPLYEQEDCECVNDDTALLKYALALVKKLTEEVNGWKAIAEGYQKQFEDCAEDRAKLTEENEKLTINMNAYGSPAKRLAEENTRLQDLIEEVQQYNEAWVEDNGNLRKEVETVKADTVRKMQERLKADLNNVARWSMHGDENEYFIVGKGFIDQIAKEMLEGDEGK